MKHYKTTRQGNLYYRLKTDQVGIIYPKTGMVRVSMPWQAKAVGFKEVPGRLYYLNKRKEVEVSLGKRTINGNLVEGVYTSEKPIPYSSLEEMKQVLRNYENKKTNKQKSKL